MSPTIAKGTASRSIALDLDPGKYFIKVTKFTPDGIGNVCWGQEFFVDMDEETFRRIQGMRAKWVETVHTTEGPRHRCTIPGCSEVNMSPFGAVIHEMKDHFGIDPLEAGDEEMEEVLSSPLAAQPQKRGPGRPRKNQQAEAEV